VGFVAASQVAFVEGGSRWIVPANLHAPIAQDAVLLKSGAGNDAARAFLAFLNGAEARAVIEKFGYGIGD
jgi:molybdate transport system substrate-binding protein